MIIKVDASKAHDANTIVSLRCPGCRQQGTFDPLPQINDVMAGGALMGQRRCPNDKCHAHIFFVRQDGAIAVVYPAERLDFDSSGIPQPVVAAFEEAITCHAIRCFTAAAIMVRKALEELCTDRGATGPNLKERLKTLSSKIMVPQELIEGMDHLRLLGNDAAHIESQTYQQIGQEEVEIGLLFAKEVLKSVYPYATLLGRLKALQKGSSESV